MSGVITTGSFPKALWPGIKAWWGTNYDEREMEYTELFEIVTSDKAYEEDVEAIGFGLAPVKAQGTSVQYDTSRQGFVTRYTNQAYALGFIVTYEEMEDNLYPKLAFQRTRRLAFSMKTTKEIVGANIYNRAFNNAFPGGDGVSLLNTAHPTDNGPQSNRLAVDSDLNESALEDLCIQIRDTEDSRGLRINAKPMKLVVPTELMFVAERILSSTLQNDTANNAINAIRSMGIIPEGYCTNTYLTDPDAWFLRTNIPESMKFYNREETTFSNDNDFDTKNMKHMAYMRFVPGWSDWRGLFGSPGG